MAALAEFVCLEPLSLSGISLPVTLRFPSPLTDEELIVFSSENRPYRIERNANGEVEVMSPVGFEGGQRELFAGRILGNWAEDHGGVTVSPDTGFKLGDTSVRCPDASWISDERVSHLTSAERRSFAPICPEFLIEVRSESDSRSALETKMAMWMMHGAQLAWLIDPFAATVSIYRPGQPVEVLDRPEYVEADSVVNGFRLPMARLWAN